MTKVRDTIEICLIASFAAILSSGLVIFLNRASAAPKYPQPRLVSAAANDVIGAQAGDPKPAAKPYTLVEYMDYQCPPCRRVEPLIQQYVGSHAAKMRLVVHNFPLPMHRYAQPAAIMAEAAREQGRFQEVHAALLRSDSLDKDALHDIAVQQKLDLPRLSQSEQTTAKATVLADMKRAGGLNVAGTPTLFLCGPGDKVVEVYDIKQVDDYLR